MAQSEHLVLSTSFNDPFNPPRKAVVLLKILKFRTMEVDISPGTLNVCERLFAKTLAQFLTACEPFIWSRMQSKLVQLVLMSHWTTFGVLGTASVVHFVQSSHQNVLVC